MFYIRKFLNVYFYIYLIIQDKSKKIRIKKLINKIKNKMNSHLNYSKMCERTNMYLVSTIMI